MLRLGAHLVTELPKHKTEKVTPRNRVQRLQAQSSPVPSILQVQPLLLATPL